MECDWLIRGVDRATGFETTTTIRATTKAEAIAKASTRGIITESANPTESPAPKPSTTEGASTGSKDGDDEYVDSLAKSIGTIATAFQIVGWLAIVLSIVGGLTSLDSSDGLAISLAIFGFIQGVLLLGVSGMLRMMAVAGLTLREIAANTRRR